ncbi:MAG: hypothetical protein A3G18_12550 [Rhodospirillales bacterium RIFCSPLOWO2_12_FULL_58_28]|nr:MAG: hypothetical protein A3H92_00500 [Rhodospirillales bacterium RIFCSPLOWO2_02_FULL_58_16]OHC79567.1 MAG: hypothetical protein A3G18_12550 [Rhodospirillales bacterium RIFCSPLOWO2_12_FULL_58_28]
MAINGSEVKIIKYLIDSAQARMKRRPRVLTLGYPDVMAIEKTFSRLELPVEWSAVPKRPDGPAVWKSQGRDLGNYPMCESKALIDALGGDCVVIDAIAWGQEDELVNLNQPLTKQQKEKLGDFDVIVDPGTVEHCFNIAQAFINIVDLLAPLGFVYHQAAVAYPNHGFWSISPTAFFDFYESRRFILGTPYVWVDSQDKDSGEPQFLQIDPFEAQNNFPPVKIGSFIFQKRHETTVRVSGPHYPIQRCYSSKSRDISTIDFAGHALGRERKDIFPPQNRS